MAPTTPDPQSNPAQDPEPSEPVLDAVLVTEPPSGGTSNQAIESEWRAYVHSRMTTRFVLRLLLLPVIVTILFFGFIFGVLPFFLVLATVIFVVSAESYVKRRALLGAVRSAIQRGLPLEPVLHGFASDSNPFTYKKLEKVSQLLNQGYHLSLAFRGGGRYLLPRHALLAIECGEACGKLPEAFDELCEDHGAKSTVASDLALRIFLLCFTIISTAFVCSFLSLWIVPKFEAIFEDFGTTLPISPNIFPFVMMVVLPLLGFFFLIVFGIMLFCDRNFYGLFGWTPPGMRWAVRGFDLSTSMRGLAMFIDAERPILDGLRMIRDQHPILSVRKSYASVVIDVEKGKPWIESLETHGVLKESERVLLESGERTKHPAWALREIGRLAQNKGFYRSVVGLTFFHAIGLFILAGLTTLVAMYLFTALTGLTNALT
jgi:type II secretory pathway component PulF